MQLSSATNQGIIQRATFLIFGSTTDHSTAYPLQAMTMSANTWLNRVGGLIWRASGTWEYDDANYTTLAEATTTLVNGQSDYTMPTTAIAIRGVAVMDSSGDWVKLEQFDKTNFSEDWAEVEPTGGLPRYYDIDGNSVLLKPAPATGSVTLASGLKIYLAREASTFSVPATYTTADTTQPGFDEPFHEIIPLGIAHDYFLGNKDYTAADKLYERVTILFNEINEHYGMKNKDSKQGIRVYVEDYT